ncbi:MAG: hypothetical protein F4X44_00800 [Gammaproteobacteria bacterium]|nr:hypothetical protein [Gammaproteobacteria bacterium]MYD79142.1 hypothetical protein [Gammaproteobacteria bacterium]
MKSITYRGRPLQGCVGLAVFCCCITFSATLADLEEQAEEISESNDSQFTVLNTVESIHAYREERRIQTKEGLSASSLSDQHQDLIASAMSKMYLGVPISSYTHSEREESSDEEPSESSFEYFVSEDGRIRHESEQATISLNLTSASPFLFLPPLPFDASTGRVVEESDAEAVFVFDFAMPIDDEDDDEFAGLRDKMNWIAKVTVGKHDQSPRSLILMLEKPVRKRFMFKLKTLSMEFQYTQVESCNGFAVNRMTMEMDASAIVVGKLYTFAESTFTDIECEQPLRYLLPEQAETNFFQF